MKIGALGLSGVLLSAILIAAPSYSQDAKTPFDPVPADERNELANRLSDYTDAFRGKNWNSFYDLAADVNKRLIDGRHMSRKTFGRLMKDDSDWYRLLKFTPIRTEATPAGQFDVYGCGEFPSGDKKPERVAVGVRPVREHGAWFFTTWDYFDPRQLCSNLSDPAWKPSHHLSLEYLPEVVCVIGVCTL
jgi:hypothetical protein